MGIRTYYLTAKDGSLEGESLKIRMEKQVKEKGMRTRACPSLGRSVASAAKSHEWMQLALGNKKLAV